MPPSYALFIDGVAESARIITSSHSVTCNRIGMVMEGAWGLFTVMFLLRRQFIALDRTGFDYIRVLS